LATHLHAGDLRDITAFEKLAPEWSKLCERSPNASPFQRPEWLIPYARVFEPQQLWGIEVRDGERLVAFAPLVIDTKGKERAVVPLGLGVSDYLDVLADSGSAAVATALRHIQEQSDSWDLLRFAELRHTSYLLRAELPEGWQRATSNGEPCPVLQLPEAEDGLMEAASTRMLARLRNARRRLEREGQVSVQTVTPETLPAMLEAFFDLHGKRWRSVGAQGVLSDASVRKFHRLAAPGLLHCGVLRLYVLRLNDHPIAALYAFFDKAVAYFYLQGFDPAFGTYSPGGLILETVLREAWREGMRNADMLRGREAYKYKWGARDYPTFSLQIRKRAPTREDLAA
jgi:CelD/BcsL family acetyltransferase involved in cellulose biosynthesis